MSVWIFFSLGSSFNGRKMSLLHFHFKWCDWHERQTRVMRPFAEKIMIALALNLSASETDCKWAAKVNLCVCVTANDLTKI